MSFHSFCSCSTAPRWGTNIAKGKIHQNRVNECHRVVIKYVAKAVQYYPSAKQNVCGSGFTVNYHSFTLCWAYFIITLTIKINIVTLTWLYKVIETSQGHIIWMQNGHFTECWHNRCSKLGACSLLPQLKLKYGNAILSVFFLFHHSQTFYLVLSLIWHHWTDPCLVIITCWQLQLIQCMLFRWNELWIRWKYWNHSLACVSDAELESAGD